MPDKEEMFIPILDLVRKQPNLLKLATSEYIQLIEDIVGNFTHDDHYLLMQEFLSLLRELQQYKVKKMEIYGKVIPIDFYITLVSIYKPRRDLYKCIINGYCSSDTIMLFKRLITFLKILNDAVEETHELAIEGAYHQMSRVPQDYSADAIRGNYNKNKEIVSSEITLKMKKDKIVLDLLIHDEIEYDFFIDLDRIHNDGLFSKEEFKKFVFKYFSIEERSKYFKQ